MASPSSLRPQSSPAVRERRQSSINWSPRRTAGRCASSWTRPPADMPGSWARNRCARRGRGRDSVDSPGGRPHPTAQAKSARPPPLQHGRRAHSARNRASQAQGAADRVPRQAAAFLVPGIAGRGRADPPASDRGRDQAIADHIDGRSGGRGRTRPARVGHPARKRHVPCRASSAEITIKAQVSESTPDDLGLCRSAQGVGTTGFEPVTSAL